MRLELITFTFIFFIYVFLLSSSLTALCKVWSLSYSSAPPLPIIDDSSQGHRGILPLQSFLHSICWLFFYYVWVKNWTAWQTYWDTDFLESLNPTGIINNVLNASQLKSQLINNEDKALRGINTLQNLALMFFPERLHLPLY